MTHRPPFHASSHTQAPPPPSIPQDDPAIPHRPQSAMSHVQVEPDEDIEPEKLAELARSYPTYHVAEQVWGGPGQVVCPCFGGSCGTERVWGGAGGAGEGGCCGVPCHGL